MRILDDMHDRQAIKWITIISFPGRQVRSPRRVRAPTTMTPPADPWRPVGRNDRSADDDLRLHPTRGGRSVIPTATAPRSLRGPVRMVARLYRV